MHVTCTHITQLSSTNDYALHWLRTAQPGSALQVTTQEQSAGRGQRGREWNQVPGQDLAWSLAIKWPHSARTDIPALHPIAFNKVVTSAVCEALRSWLDPSVHIGIKWPNDIMLSLDSDAKIWRKCAGLLIENTWRGNRWDGAVVGLGLNVHSQRLREAGRISLGDFAGPLGSLESLESIATALRKTILQHLERHPGTAVEAFDALLIGKDQWNPYRLAGESGLGRVNGVDSNGALEFDWRDADGGAIRRTVVADSTTLSWEWLVS